MCDKPPQSPRRRRSDVMRQWRRLSWPMRLAALPIYFYRIALSPLWPHICRFEPSCSAYALDALAEHGLLRGTWLALRRVARCHPFESLGGGSGYDPVPPRRGRRVDDADSGGERRRERGGERGRERGRERMDD